MSIRSAASTLARRQLSHIDSIDEIINCLEAGECLVLCAPTCHYGNQLLGPLVNSILPISKTLLISTRSPEQPLPSGNALRTFDLSVVSNAKGTLSLIRRELERLPARGTLLMTAVGGDRRAGLFDLLVRATVKIRQRLVWLVSHDAFTDDELFCLKQRSDFFLEITDVGTAKCLQVIAARRVYSPELFFPRIVSLENDRITLSSPVVPATPIAPSEDDGDTQVPPQHHVADLLEEKYHKVVDAAPGPLIIFKLKERYFEINNAGRDLLGYSAEEMKKLRFVNLVPVNVRIRLLRNLIALRRKGRADIETRVLRKNGRLIDVRLQLSAMEDDFFVGIAFDVTALRKSEASLKRREEEAGSLIAHDPIPRAVYANNRLLFHNAAFLQAFGPVHGEKSERQTLLQLLGKRNRELAKEINALAEAGANPTAQLTREAPFTSSNGNDIFFEITAVPVSFGEKPGVHCTFVDVTTRTSIMQALRQSETKFRTLADTSPEAISIEEAGRLTYVNKEFLRVFGFRSVDEIVGKEASSLSSAGSDLLRSQPKKDRKLPPGQELESVRRNDGSTVQLQVHRMSLQGGHRPAKITFLRDVSAERQREEERQRRVQAIEKAHGTSLALIRLLGFEDLLRQVLSSYMNTFDLELGAVYRVESDGIALRMTTHERFSERLVAGLSNINISEGLTGYAAKTREPLLLTMGEYPPYLPFKSLFETEKIQSLVVVPLTSDDTVAGMLILASKRARSWGPDERDILSSLGAEIDSILNNAHAYEELKRSEEMFRSTAEGVPDVLYRCSANGTFLYIGSGVEALTGHVPREFYAYTNLLRDLIHPDDRPTYSRRITTQTGDAAELHIEYRLLPRGKASYRRVRDSIRFQRNEHGEIQSFSGIMSDITDRSAATQDSLRAESLKADILNSVQEGVVVFDVELKYLDWNKAMEQITGIPPESVIGKPFVHGVSEESIPELRLLLERALEGESGSSENMPFPVATADKEHFFWNQYAPLRDSGGITKGVVGIVTDVTSRRELEREVRDSEETLRNVVDTMGDALMICDLQGRVWEVNREFSRMTGYSRKEVLGTDFPYPWVLEGEMGKYVEWVGALRDKNYLRDFDTTWMAKDQHLVAISMSTTLLRNALGEPVAMLNISRDITERKHLSRELERKVEENARLYAEVQAQVHRITLLYELGKSLTGTLDMLTLLDIVQTEIAKAMPVDRFSYYTITGEHDRLTPVYEMSRGQRKFERQGIVSQQIAVNKGDPFWNLITEGTSFVGPSLSGKKPGNSLLAVPMKSKEAVVGVLAVMKAERDSYTETHLRLLESIANLTEIAMEKALLYEDTVDKAREIENRNKELDDFTYVVSHDLKEPLISIEGYSKILLKDYQSAVDQEGKEYLGTVVQATSHMKNLIDDLLTLSRVGHVKESVESISSGDVIREVLRDIQFTLRARNVTVNVVPAMPQVRYNRTQLGMVFRNLISNAVKFNDKPQPTIDIAVKDEDAHWVFTVADNGIGIDSKYYARIFLIFQRLQRKEDFEGTGAGLTIVKKIVENHHGRIWVDSVVGAGTTFSFTIPK